MSAFNKFGKSDSGNTSEIVLIAAVEVPAGRIVEITDFIGTAGPDSAKTVMTLQASTDDFNADIRNKARLEIPAGATFGYAYDSPKRFVAGEKIRVVASQGTASRESAELSGQIIEPPAGEIASILN